jgi:hypothetical protein
VEEEVEEEEGLEADSEEIEEEIVEVSVAVIVAEEQDSIVDEEEDHSAEEVVKEGEDSVIKDPLIELYNWDTLCTLLKSSSWSNVRLKTSLTSMPPFIWKTRKQSEKSTRSWEE